MNCVFWICSSGKARHPMNWRQLRMALGVLLIPLLVSVAQSQQMWTYQNPFTGRTAQNYSYRNPFTGQMEFGRSVYNPLTGGARRFVPERNPLTGAQGIGVEYYNPWTGRYGYVGNRGVR